jgi:diguanylate cyclase (GGDEF)-like protein
LPSLERFRELEPHGGERIVEPAEKRRGPWSRLAYAWRYASVGAVLGVGAPVGAFGLRALGGARLATELREYAFFYLYDLVGTCLVFAVVGFIAGRRADRLRSGRERYRTLSELDSLTNLVNSRTFGRHFERAVEHAARFQEPLSLLLVDVDQLKALNDELGHSFGNAALLHVGKVLETSKRAADVAARWGGDEFTLLMAGAGPEAAHRQAEAILERLRAEPVRVDGRERIISATIGVATSTRGGGGDLFEAADRALYAGKKMGRGQVQSAEA